MGERKYPTAVPSSLTEKYPTLVHSRHPVPPKAGGRDGLEALVKFTAQRLGIRKRLKPTHRIAALLLHLFSYTLPPQY